MNKFFLYLAAISFLILAQGQTAFCDETADGDDESSAFSNPAQVTHAANLADAAAAAPNETTAGAQQDVDDAKDALADLTKALAAKEGLTDAQEDALADDIATAQATLDNAEEAYADAVAELTGVMTGEIATMRAEGMGWGDIAHELGVHPGLLGLGHTKQYKNKFSGDAFEIDGEAGEIAAATRRDAKTGWAKGHGLSTSKSSSASKGLGLAKGAQTKGNSGNVKGGSSGSNGNSGSNSKGSVGRDSSGAPGNSGNSKGSNGSSKEKSNNGKSNNDKGNKK